MHKQRGHVVLPRAALHELSVHTLGTRWLMTRGVVGHQLDTGLHVSVMTVVLAGENGHAVIAAM